MLAILLLVWIAISAGLYVALWRSPSFTWGNHPWVLANDAAVIICSALLNLYRASKSIWVSLHLLLSALVYMGAYLSITTSVMNGLKGDFWFSTPRFWILASLSFTGTVIDLWYRTKYRRWPKF